MRPAGALLPLLLAACASSPEPATMIATHARPECYRLPPARWGDCLERARRIDFNVYECERRALLLRPAPASNPGGASGE